jgi:hypothetical protein
LVLVLRQCWLGGVALHVKLYAFHVHSTLASSTATTGCNTGQKNRQQWRKQAAA